MVSAVADVIVVAANGASAVTAANAVVIADRVARKQHPPQYRQKELPKRPRQSRHLKRLQRNLRLKCKRLRLSSLWLHLLR